MKNWNRTQNAADLGVFYRCEDCACMLHSTLRAQISQNVKYWYEICDVFGTIFHALRRIGTNFSLCEIREIIATAIKVPLITLKHQSLFSTIFFQCSVT